MKRAIAFGAVAVALVVALGGCGLRARNHDAAKPGRATTITTHHPTTTSTTPAPAGTAAKPGSASTAAELSSVDKTLSTIDTSLSGVDTQISDANKAGDDDE
jgi:succinate dehydrogenase/fumarate reductase flavoprotein subunit